MKNYIIYKYDGNKYDPYRWTRSETIKQYYEKLKNPITEDVPRYDIRELKENENIYDAILKETSNTSKYYCLCEKGIYCENCNDKKCCDIPANIIAGMEREKGDINQVINEEEETN